MEFKSHCVVCTAGFFLPNYEECLKSGLSRSRGKLCPELETKKSNKSAQCLNNCFSFAGRRNPSPQPVPEPGTPSVRLRLRRRRRHQSQTQARNFATSWKRNLATSRRRTSNFGTFLSLDEGFCLFYRICNYFHKLLFLLF